MSAITGLTELIYHAAGIGGGMTGTQISEAIRSVRAEAWDDGYEACAHYHSLDTEHSAPNPYQDK